MIFAIALLVNFLAQACAWTVPPPTFSSEITFYNLGSEGQAGNCAYESISPVGASSYKQLPFANGVQTFVALNSEQYDGTSTCGQCLIYQGIGGGSGTTPVPKTPQYGMVTDQCPEVSISHPTTRLFVPQTSPASSKSLMARLHLTALYRL